MDNCLASNSETGGVGCDNMTMAVVALLQGKSKDEWYQKIADRVAAGDGPCAPPEYGKSSPSSSTSQPWVDRSPWLPYGITYLTNYVPNVFMR